MAQNYKFITGKNLLILQEHINAQILDGFIPLGSPFDSQKSGFWVGGGPETLVQPMYRIPPPSPEEKKRPSPVEKATEVSVTTVTTTMTKSQFDQVIDTFKKTQEQMTELAKAVKQLSMSLSNGTDTWTVLDDDEKDQGKKN